MSTYAYTLIILAIAYIFVLGSVARLFQSSEDYENSVCGAVSLIFIVLLVVFSIKRCLVLSDIEKEYNLSNHCVLQNDTSEPITYTIMQETLLYSKVFDVTVKPEKSIHFPSTLTGGYYILTNKPIHSISSTYEKLIHDEL